MKFGSYFHFLSIGLISVSIVLFLRSATAFYMNDASQSAAVSTYAFYLFAVGVIVRIAWGTLSLQKKI